MSGFRLLLAALFLLIAPSLAAAQWGVAPDGTKGRLHVVVKGDTLWDITETHLGTPWIWPSIWKENAIDNPHLIYPGDLIWITRRGIRKMTPEEAAQIRPLSEEELLESGEPAVEPEAAAPAPEPMVEPETDATDPFASLDGGRAEIERFVRFPGLHRYGFISPAELDGSGAILGSHEPAYWVSQERKTIVSLGEGQAHVGDRYTIFRTRRRVLHPTTGAVVGYFVQNLGTAEVAEIHPESSFVKILTSYSEIEPGDRLRPYEEEREKFAVRAAEVEFNGIVLARQPYRQWAGAGDLVVIDRGKFDGVSVGNELELYSAGKEVLDPITGSKVLVPDDILGRMFVLKVGPNTALAVIRKSRREIQVGDHFRSL